MRNTRFTITVPHQFTSISAFGADSNPHITTLRFNVHETLQINQSNFLISNNTFNQGT